MDMKQRGLEREATGQRAVVPLAPPVDIIENGDGITVRADLPGVSREDLSIGVDGDTLTVEASMSLGESANVQPVYAEVRTAQYKRSFVLSRDLDTGKINASIRNGVLTLQVPKREQAKPRRIEIKAE
jgi:HSP20 family molecular chaperone IbpA